MTATLPNGWTSLTLGEIGKWGSGGTPSRSNLSFYIGSIPWFKTGELGPRVIYKSEENISEEAIKASSAKIFPAGSIALAMYGATIGKTSILGVDAATNQACAVAAEDNQIVNKEYLFNYLKSQKDGFIAAGQGGAQPNISQTVIKAWPIPLAPLHEQRRIADKLDTTLARVDALNDRLARITPMLKRFRQSVLAAATSGRLTEDWREGKRIAKGRLGFLGELGEVLAGQSPSVSEVNYEGRGTPYVTGPEQWDGKKLLTHKWTEFPKRIAPEGSIFITVKGAGVGKTFPGCYAAIGRDVYAFVVNENYEVKYVLFAIQASAEEVILNAKGLIPGLTKKDICEHNVYIPHVHEQTEIVRRVETLFTFADRLEARLQSAQTAAERLTPALLAKAFRGELVPQDPSDEPAAELLHRLREARLVEASSKSKRGLKIST